MQRLSAPATVTGSRVWSVSWSSKHLINGLAWRNRLHVKLVLGPRVPLLGASQGVRPVRDPSLTARPFGGPSRNSRSTRLTSSGPPQPPPASSADRPPEEPPEPLSLALEAVLARFSGLVRRVGWKHGLDGDDLDEVMQDVRLRLWRARGDSEQIQASSASYVYRTAMSAALDLIRRRRRTVGWQDKTGGNQPEGENEIDQVPSSLPGGGSPETDLEASEVSRAVELAISRISKARRPVVRMYLMGHPPMEIATLMGWTEPKMRNLLYRGLADLRAELTAMGYGPGGAVA